MKKQLTFLLLCSLLSSTFCASSAPQALWKVMGDCAVEPKPGEASVALAYFLNQRDIIKMRVERAGKKVIDSRLPRTEVLKALKEGTIVALYKKQPTAAVLMPELDSLTSTVEEAFEGKNEVTSQELHIFCAKVDQQFSLRNPVPQ